LSARVAGRLEAASETLPPRLIDVVTASVPKNRPAAESFPPQ